MVSAIYILLLLFQLVAFNIAFLSVFVATNPHAITKNEFFQKIPGGENRV